MLLNLLSNMERFFRYLDPATGKRAPMSMGIPPSSATPDFLKQQNLTSPPPLKLLFKPYSAEEWYVLLSGMKPKDPTLWNVDTWMCFLVSWMIQTFEGELPTDITCFGHILVKQKKIDPTDLLTVKWGTATHEGMLNLTGNPSHADMNRLALSMMGLYRLCKVTTRQSDYKKQISERIRSLSTAPLFVNGTYKMSTLLDQSDFAIGIVNDVRLKRLMAALDMYLDIFSAGEQEMFRVATIVLRYEDCAMLGLISTVAKVISKSITCAMTLCFDAGAAKEINEMYRYETSEITKNHSYLPYCRSMGLVSRSPYSVPMNISFYTYYTTLLACLDNVRGLNAIHLPAAPVTKMLNTTSRIAYLIKGSNDNQLFFVGESKAQAISGSSSPGSAADD